MLGASLSEVWGEDFKPKKKIKRKKNKPQPLTPDEMDSELLITESDRNQFKTNEYDRRKLLRDDRFLEQNYKKFDVVIGMYHDQVLAPLKALKGFSAINITLGLPFLRISPDHGPNFQMIGKNKSNPQSFLEAIKFLDSGK